jgi:muramoyltetrapeptide carboxypeptidase
MKKLIPLKLNQGDTIGVVSPSGPVRDLERFGKGVSYLESRGYKVLVAEHALTRYYHMSATASEKAADINGMFADFKVKAIFPSLGGHTASQVLDYLDWDLITRNPKIFFGFSDNSVMLNAIYVKTGLVCFHSLCDVVFGFGDFGSGKFETEGEYTSKHLFRVITDTEPTNEIPKLSNWSVLKAGAAEGVLVGGNLSTIRSLIGSDFEPDWTDKILFLEDSAEPHRWDQQLGHLHLAGVLNRIAGLVVGRVEKPDKFYPENYQPLPQIFLRHLEGREIPFLYGVDLGHNIENCTLPVGLQVRLDGNNGTLSLLEGAVRA